MGREPEYVVHSQKWEKAVATQVNLGWYAFLCGFVAKPLIDIQHDHYLELELRRRQKDGQSSSFIKAGTSCISYGRSET
jgi:hypothetical protein